MVKWAGIAVAAALIAGTSHVARADTCYETAQVNIDCTAKSGGGTAGKSDPSTSQLREILRRSLASHGRTTSAAPSGEALGKAIADAESRARRALAAASGTTDPARQDKALKAYNAALSDLDKAYDRAIDATSPQARAELEGLKANDEQRLLGEANAAFAAQRQAAETAREAARAQEPDNVGTDGNSIFVCDGPVDGDHVACREVQHDGSTCVSAIVFEGEVSWRDSTAIPCKPEDLAQRTAYLARHPGDERPEPRFVLDRDAACKAIIADYIKKAEAQDGPGARADYEKLSNAGGCNVLDEAEEKLQAQAGAGARGDPRFATRGDTSMIDQVAVPCDQNPAACAAAIDEARAGASPAAIAAIYANAIGIGLELGGIMGNAVLNAQAANMASHAAALNNAARAAPRNLAQYPRAISCTVRGCITSDGRGPGNDQSTITGTIK